MDNDNDTTQNSADGMSSEGTSGDAMGGAGDAKVCEGCNHAHKEDGKCTDDSCSCGTT